jgi:membrane dipeptidase
VSYPVFDLHCDLLAYLSVDQKARSPLDDASNCSLPLLKQGGVFFQTLALFTETNPSSRIEFQKQLECFKSLEGEKQPQFVLAIENASGLLTETEPFELMVERLSEKKWVYISLTWKEENRFGGGNNTQVGLKEDGEKLLELLSGKKIAIDLSHASDPLAEDILNVIDKKSLDVTPIASHSNFRTIHDELRNLPDDFAKEIIKLGGVIGINFVRHFVGDDPRCFVDHIQKGLELGAEDSLVLGSDFFGGLPALENDPLEPYFFKEYSNSSCFPKFQMLTQEVVGSKVTEKLFHQNCKSFLSKIQMM